MGSESSEQRGQRAFPAQVPPTQFRSVEGLTIEEELIREGGTPPGFDEFEVTGFVRSVDLVSEDGQPSVVEVGANLVHATGARPAFEQGKSSVVPLETLSDGNLGLTGFPFRVNPLSHPDGRGGEFSPPSEGCVDEKVVFLRPTPADRDVGFLELSSRHRQAEFAGSLPVFGHENQATRFPVQPGDDRELSPIRKFVDQQILESIEQGGWLVRGRRVDDEMSWFVDDDEVIALGDHGEVGLVETEVDERT